MLSAARPASERAETACEHVSTLTERWNDRSVPETSHTVPALFAAAVRATPNARALVDGTLRYTYRELADRVDALARRLLEAGLPAEGTVAICMPRSAEMVVAVLACMTAGGAFVPVDPQWPASRREQVLAESSATIALTAPGDDMQCADVPSDDERAGVTTITVDLDADAARATPAIPSPDSPSLAIRGDRLAYVIFTSGSTGAPKGAMIRHEAICERLTWQRDTLLGFGAGDASLFKAPLAFDISVNEILLPLISGGCVVVAAPGIERDPERLLRLIVDEGVTFLYLVSSMLDIMLSLDAARPPGSPASLAGVRHVWCGGEVLTPDLFRRFREQLTTTLYHGYGPAEATIGVSHVVYRDSAARIATSIGRPNPHTQLYVLDERLQPAPAGVGGELYAAGFLLGRGYIGRSGLSAAAFVANPFETDGARMYRTGDLARWTPDGALEFLGRADNQVKIRGRRVELEEIEVAVSRHPLVRQAAVTLTHSATGAERLTGYVVGTAGAVIDVDALLTWCRERLPEYMVPASMLVLDGFPLTTNGKVDRRALPAAAEAAGDRAAPSTPDERLLCDVLADALGVDEIGVDDDFFAMGGDSIVAVTVTLALRAVGRTLRAKDIVAHRTPRRLAEALADGEPPVAVTADDARETPLVDLDAADAAELDAAVPGLREVLPVTSVQSGIYFHAVETSGPDPYVVQQIVELAGPLDPERLRHAAAAVVARHDALAAGFRLTRSGRVVATIGTGEPVAFRTLPRPDGDDAAVTAAVQQIAERERRRGFDLARPPLMRYALIPVGDDRHMLVHTVHHIVADGWSVALIWDDIMAGYHGSALTDAAPQHADFLRWWTHRRDPAGELAAWTRYLGGVDGPTLVTDHLPPSATTGTGFGRRHRTLDNDRRRALTAFARSHSVTEGAVMTAAWGILLGCVTGSTDVVFGTTTAGRGEDVEGIDRIVGMVLNTVPTRVRWSHHDTLDAIVREFVAAETAVLDHQHVPLIDVHGALDVRELFDSLLSIENLRRPRDVGELRVESIDYLQAPHYRLTALVTLHETVSIVMTNDRSAIDDATADLLAERYLHIVGLLVDGTAETARAFPALGLAGADAVPIEGAKAVPSAPVAQQFAHRLAASPGAVAVVQGSTTWTFAELGERVHRLARLLITRGVGSETRVALAMGRTPELAVGLLAIVAAGGVVVPLDPEHPTARLSYAFADAAPRIVLTTRASEHVVRKAGVPAACELVIVDAPATSEHLDALSAEPIRETERAPLHREHGAYLLYTSGSTGEPKGVLGTQAALADRLAWAAARWAAGGPDAGMRLAKTSIGFIDGVTEMLGALLSGAAIVLADEAATVDADRLAALIATHGVDHVTGVPTLLQAIAEVGGSRVRDVRRWISSGEALTSAAVERIAAAAPDSTIINSYGSSEVAGDVADAHMAVGERIAIGAPVPGVRALLLDSWLRSVPDGVVGELYVGGTQLARGYAGRAATTAARFVPDPSGPPGARLYRTGDLARRAADGRLEFVGRGDFQVQLGGIRIELEEVETVLAAVPGVRAAAAAVHGADGTRRLVGYVTPTDGHRLDEQAVRDAIAATLPLHVAPAVVVLDALPRTPTGKVDRAALPAPEPVRSTAAAPTTQAERILVAAAADALDLATVGVDDDFFALGGDSISAMSLARRARTGGLELSVRDVFTLRTPARLAAAHERDGTRGHRAGESTSAADPVAIAPTVAQHRLRLARLPLAGFVLTDAVAAGASTDADALRAAVTAVLHEVDALRQRVSPRHALLWTTEIVPFDERVVEASVSVVDSAVTDPDAAARDIRDDLVARVDITEGRPLHAALVRTAAGARLVVAVHGLAADRTSARDIANRVAAHLDDDTVAAHVGSVADAAAALAALVPALETTAAVDGWIDEALALPTVEPRSDDAGARTLVGRTVPLPEGVDADAVEAAFVAAVAACSDVPRAIDREWDLRRHLHDAAVLGACTSVYPVLANVQTTATPPDHAPWLELLRVHSKAAKARLRKAPHPAVLLTRVPAPVFAPSVAEGFEQLYEVVGRYALDVNTVELQVLASDAATALLEDWAARLTVRSTL